MVRLADHRAAVVRIAGPLPGTVAEYLDSMFDPTVTFDTVAPMSYSDAFTTIDDPAPELV